MIAGVARPHSSVGRKYKYICTSSVKLRDTWEVRKALYSLCVSHGADHFNLVIQDAVCRVTSWGCHNITLAGGKLDLLANITLFICPAAGGLIMI